MSFSRYQTKYARLDPVAGGIAFSFSFDAGMLSVFKMNIPSESRRWDGNHKYWIVDSKYADSCAKLALLYLGIQITMPARSRLDMQPQTETRLIKVEYIGRAKERGAGDLSATAFVNGGWNVIFPEDVLRAWFEAIPQRPGEKLTLYAVLGIKSSATQEEIKSAYRRMARMTHPDVSKEEDAAEQFKIVDRAFKMLSDPILRQRYNAGLAMEIEMRKPSNQTVDYIYNMDGQLQGYKPPFRCGWLLVEGIETLGRLNVSKIIQWEEITNAQGQILVTSWPAGADKFVEKWV